ncbi:MAG TPA: efflux transporter outer membrane subunit [Allosphingosinicella sp.]|jgi:NodT family efflux transporter outer membrane factor (OMF) lipoprotein|nr:efflux transporter outer membrane subunit [Allosphingosinicella sp.]
MVRRPLVLLLVLAAGGCAPHVRLAVEPNIVSTEWREGAPSPTAEPVGAEHLADALGSAELRRLTEHALAANADLEAATARIERARAELGTARAAMLPVISGSAGASHTRSDDKTDPYRFSEGFAQLDISYDLDLFGAARAGKRAARARAAAARFDRDATALVVETEVARAWVQYCALTDRIRLLDRSIADERELERIIGVRYREGAATKVDTGLQAIETRNLETERVRLVEAQERTRDALALLAGEEAPLFNLADGSLAEIRVPALAPVQPGELLVRRPDVRAAEARIKAADGDVDAARRAFLPGLHLSASGLGQAATLSGPVASTLAIGASLLGPIFDRARLNGRLHVAAADQHESVALYRKTLLNALKESEDALAGAARSAERERLIADVVANAETTTRLARMQYLEGDADLRTVLDAQRQLVQAEDARALVVQERLNAAADLYEAMGGVPQGPAYATPRNDSYQMRTRSSGLR